MSRAELSPLPARELAAAARHIARDSPAAARALRAAVADALDLIRRYPASGALKPHLAPSPIRFRVVRGYSYVLVYDAESLAPLTWIDAAGNAAGIEPEVGTVEIAG